MIEPQHILRLLLYQYHDGRFLNGHPEIAEYIDQSGLCYVEQLPDELEHLTYNNVRIWSSKDMCEKRKKESLETTLEFYRKYAEPSVKVERVLHPLEVELYTLCETAQTALEFTRVVEIKTKLRRLGIKIDQNKTSIRKMAKL